jgi:hypothetical protein
MEYKAEPFGGKKDDNQQSLVCRARKHPEHSKNMGAQAKPQPADE